MNKKMKMAIIALALSVMLFGCDLFGPSVEDASEAFTVLAEGIIAVAFVTPTTVVNADGSLTATAATTGNTVSYEMNLNAAGTSATTTYTFDDFVGDTSGYTANGTVSVDITLGSTTTTQELTGSLSLTGGVVSTLSVDYTTDLTNATGAMTFTGSITADGKEFDIVDIEESN